MNQKRKFSYPGFTLQELLVVLVIIEILTLPNLMPLISRAKEAQMQLSHLYTLGKNSFYLKSRYSTDLLDLGFEQEKLVTDGGSANYLIEIIEAKRRHF